MEVPELPKEKKKALTHLEKVIVLIILLITSMSLHIETFPNKPNEELLNLTAIPVEAVALVMSVRIVWRDPLGMKAFGTVVALISALLLTLGLRDAFFP